MPDWRIFQTSAWLRFIEATQGARLLRLGVYDAGQLVGCWAAGKLHKGGLRIVGSPMRGWNTPYMAAASHDLPSMELLKAWRRFLEDHHIHHAAQVGLQAAVFFMIVADQINQHPLLRAKNRQRFTAIARFQNGFLPLGEGDPFRTRGGIEINNIIHPSKITISPICVSDKVAIG